MNNSRGTSRGDNYWTLAIVEAAIAIAGLAGYIFSQNPHVALGAAVAMAAVGVYHPIAGARRRARQKAYVARQFERADAQLDANIAELMKKVVDARPPVREAVAAALETSIGERAAELNAACESVAAEVESGAAGAADSARRLSARLEDAGSAGLVAVGHYLEGLVHLRAGTPDRAAGSFERATVIAPGWEEPWYGWMLAEMHRGDHKRVCEINPQLRGVELVPYGPGTEVSFVALDEAQRQAVTMRLSEVMEAMGNLYAVAQIHESRRMMEEHRREMEGFG